MSKVGWVGVTSFSGGNGRCCAGTLRVRIVRKVPSMRIAQNRLGFGASRSSALSTAARSAPWGTAKVRSGRKAQTTAKGVSPRGSGACTRPSAFT
jgi:hypothetical protein